MPIINILGFTDSYGMPIGVSLVAPMFHDQDITSSNESMHPNDKDCEELFLLGE